MGRSPWQTRFRPPLPLATGPSPLALYRALRPLLFRLDAERAHGLGAALARAAPPAVLARLFPAPDERLAQTVWGLSFRGPVGLAAGFDKNATGLGAWRALGFGFAEVGSVTARPSAGNPRPRAFRLVADRALVNRMGLNNDGADAVAARLARTPRAADFVVGVNVAKTHSPAILGEAAVDDFRASAARLLPHAHYLALNVSCPNTAEGKTFETPEALDALLAAVAPLAGGVPLVVKLSPPPAAGVDAGAVDELVAVALAHGVRGFVATNTASDRAGLQTPPDVLARVGAGGVSGRPLAARARALVRHLFRATAGRVPVVGVGGVDSADAAWAMLSSGASLVQLYAGLVYEGPSLPSRIHAGLVQRLDAAGLDRLADAVGRDA